MSYTKIYPLGPKTGLSSYETFFDPSKYPTIEHAKRNNDVAIVDFVKDEDGVIYFEAYLSNNPEKKLHHKLLVQVFPFGVDFNDDKVANYMVATLWGMTAKKIKFNPIWN